MIAWWITWTKKWKKALRTGVVRHRVIALVAYTTQKSENKKPKWFFFFVNALYTYIYKHYLETKK